MKKCIAAILIVAAVFTLAGCQSENVFSQYLQYMGKPYEDISEDYEVTKITDGLAIATVPSEDIFGLPGDIDYYFLYGDEDGHDEIIDIIGWGSTQENTLTEEEIDTFVNGMIDIYGDYDKKELQESEYSFSPDKIMYWWEGQDEYNIKMLEYVDGSKITIAFQSK